MTPLAQQIVKELMLPHKRRTFVDAGGISEEMKGIHCFECTDIAKLAFDLFDKWREHQSSLSLDTNFLPAKRTWIEYECEARERRGFLLVDKGSGTWSCQFAIKDYDSGQLYSTPCVVQLADLKSSDDIKYRLLHGAYQDPPKYKKQLVDWVTSVTPSLYAFLACINTPRVIGRDIHPPHRGLQRALLARKDEVGDFHLREWTEIKLSVTPPGDAPGDGPHTGQLTGRKALHFCRSHLRIASGQLVLVRGHWRGDASLGIKRSRYVVKGPKEQA
jgi:hypothetical protein